MFRQQVSLQILIFPPTLASSRGMLTTSIGSSFKSLTQVLCLPTFRTTRTSTRNVSSCCSVISSPSCLKIEIASGTAILSVSGTAVHNWLIYFRSTSFLKKIGRYLDHKPTDRPPSLVKHCKCDYITCLKSIFVWGAGYTIYKSRRISPIKMQH